MSAIHLNDLTPDQRKAMGIPKPREKKFSQEDVRSWALKILAAMAGLTREERNRVLRHANKVNQL